MSVSTRLVPAVSLLTWLALATDPARALAQENTGRPDDPEPSGAWQLRAGATYRRLYDVPIYAGTFGAAFGGWDERGGDYVFVDLLLPGRTEYGLAFSGGAVGYRSDWQFSRARVGFSAALAVMSVERATKDEKMSGGGFAISGFAGYDVLRTPGSVLAVDLVLNLDPIFGGEGSDAALVWGPTLGVSYRL
jgi:hypothetical protein